MAGVIDFPAVGETTAVCAPPARTIRVLHLINGEHYSGAERVQDLLAARLPDFGVDVAFAALKLGRFDSMRQARSAPLYDTSMHARTDVIRPTTRLAQLIRREGFHLVHSHTPRTALLGRVASAIAGVPLVHHIHSPTVADSTNVVRDRVNAFAERWSLARVGGVVAVSASLAKYACSLGVDRNRVWVVPNGVPIAGPLARRSVPHGQWTIGSVALFRPRKGLEVLLAAMAILHRQGFPLRLRAVGPFETVEYEQKIKAEVERLDLQEAIDWIGFTRDVSAELQRMDLFVLPSLFGEGLPMVILEAMAAGVPVIGTRVEGVPEAVRDGVDGLIAEPNQPAALAHAMARVFRGDVNWAFLRESAHRRQAEKFSAASMADGVSRVYREVLAR